jgi:uncharacterized protein (TIGR02996 family)
MDVEATLLSAIVSDPEDDLLRLAYADWCEENGHGPRAELIRVQIEERQPTCSEEWRRALQRRARALLARHGRRWGGPFKAHRLSHLAYRRGFVEKANTHAQYFLASHREILTCAPIRSLTLRSATSLSEHLAGVPSLSRLSGLSLPSAGAQAIAALLRSPHLERIESLDLPRNGLSCQDLSALPPGPLAHLRHLGLDGNRLNEEDAATVLQRLAPRATSLSLADTSLGVVGLSRVAAALPWVRSIQAARLPMAQQLELRASYPGVEWRFGPSRESHP